jgi:MFS family permease
MRERLSGPAFGVCCGVISATNAGVAGVDARLAGVMVDHFGFRSIFVLSLAVGIVAFVLATLAVPAHERERRSSGRMDWVGAILIALTVAALDQYVAKGEDLGWTSPLMLAFIATAVAAFVGLVVAEKRVATSLIDIDQMASRYALPLIIATILCFASSMVVLSFISRRSPRTTASASPPAARQPRCYSSPQARWPH